MNAIAFSSPDPELNRLYDIYVGISTSGAGQSCGSTIAINNGNTPSYPTLIVHRSGGTSAVLETLRNVTNGREILFDYSLLDGEELRVDLNPLSRSILSDFFGPRLDAMLPNSDSGTFTLLPGSNYITCFVNVAGAPTITAHLEWEELFNGVD